MALWDIYEANKTTAKDQETAVVGTRQQQTLGRKDSRERCRGSLTVFALILKKDCVLNAQTNRRLILMKYQWVFFVKEVSRVMTSLCFFKKKSSLILKFQ